MYGNTQRALLEVALLSKWRILPRKGLLRTIATPSYKQRHKLPELQNTQLNLLTVPFFAI